MKEETVYTRLELYEATEDIISGIRSGISKYWSSEAKPTVPTVSTTTTQTSKKVTPDTKIVLNQADLTSAYKYMRDVLLNLFFKMGNYKTSKILRINMFNQIDNVFFKANVKANEIFLKLNEQQKKTSNISVGSGKTRVPRITFDISSILKAQKFDTLPIEQQEEIKNLLDL